LKKRLRLKPLDINFLQIGLAITWVNGMHEILSFYLLEQFVFNAKVHQNPQPAEI
jgi:hypothetical protein